MKTSILVGGQAVIEGVMMRVPGAYATALRRKDGTIIAKRKEFKSIIDKYNIKNYIIIRGMFHLYESMKIGYQTLNWSASIYEEEQENKKKSNSVITSIFEYIVNLLSICFAIGLFILLPLFSTGFLVEDINQPIYFNIVSGIIRIGIFLIYLLLISRLNDVKRLFQYHGAEHKTVYNFESGKPLNAEEAQKFSTKHPRCGTSFVFIIMLVTIFSYAILDSIALLFVDQLTIFIRFALHILCLPLVAGAGYEVLKFLASKQQIKIFNYLSKPGLWLQSITTKTPDVSQLEVAIYALKEAFGDQLSSYEGKQYNADSIG
tara:strand:- start:222 stop:1175 length:954 start_codon:yes stop_codon:yes gene_type:complete